MRATRSCHEGEAAERAVDVMLELRVDVVAVTNDNDRVTGIIVNDDLCRALKRQGPGVLRMRDVMRRLGFFVCQHTDDLEQVRRWLAERAADFAVVVDGAGRCVGVVARRHRPELRPFQVVAPAVA